MRIQNLVFPEGLSIREKTGSVSVITGDEEGSKNEKTIEILMVFSW